MTDAAVGVHRSVRMRGATAVASEEPGASTKPALDATPMCDSTTNNSFII